MEKTFAGLLELGDVIVLEGSTLEVKGLQEVEGLQEVWGLWKHAGGEELTTFPFTYDSEIFVQRRA